MLSIVIDVIVIALLWFYVMRGIKKGLVKSILEFATGIVSFIAAFLFYKPVADYLMKLSFFERLTDSVKDAIAEKMLSSAENLNQFPKWVSDVATNSVENTGALVAERVSQLAVNVIAIVLIYVVIRIVLMAFNFLFDRVKILKIGELNAFGGACFGFVNAAVIIYIAMMIVFVMATSETGSELNEAIKSTYVARLFYDNNLLTNLIFG